jgi:hypothetical protein
MNGFIEDNYLPTSPLWAYVTLVQPTVRNETVLLLGGQNGLTKQLLMAVGNTTKRQQASRYRALSESPNSIS